MRYRGFFIHTPRRDTRRKYVVPPHLPNSIGTDRGSFNRMTFEADPLVQSKLMCHNKTCRPRIGPSIALCCFMVCCYSYLLDSQLGVSNSAHECRNCFENVALRKQEAGIVAPRRRSLSSDVGRRSKRNDDGEDVEKEEGEEEEDEDEHPYNHDLLNDDRVFHQDPEDLQHDLPVEYDIAFSWNDVDLSRKGSCGLSKCFWPSVSSQMHGYLFSAESNYDNMRKSFYLARDLEESCSISHLYAEPAVLVNVTTEQMQQLDQQTFNPSRFKVGERSPYVFYVGDSSVVMQKVIAAPQPHLLYGTGGTKWDAMLNDIPSFKNHIHPRRFRRRLKNERRKIECALRHERHYWNDFQGLIDTGGFFYHIDFDSHFDMDQVSDLAEAAYIKTALNDFDEMIKEFELVKDTHYE